MDNCFFGEIYDAGSGYCAPEGSMWEFDFTAELPTTVGDLTAGWCHLPY
jgi:hypothetical protein